MGKPLFDFDGNGRIDALELLSALKDDPSNPFFSHGDDFDDSIYDDIPDADGRMDLGYLEDSDFDETGEFDDDFDSVFDLDND